MFCIKIFVYLVGLLHHYQLALESYGHTSTLISDSQVGYTSSQKDGHCLSCVHHFIFSWKLFFTIIPDYFRLTQILRLSLATGCMDAVTFTSDVCNTFINRFVLKRSPYRYGENFFWRSFWAIEGSGAAKLWAEGSLDSWLTSVSPDIADHHHKMNSDHWIVDTNMSIFRLKFF